MEKLNLNNTLLLNATLTLPFSILLLIFTDAISGLLGMEIFVVELIAVYLLLFSTAAWLAAKISNVLIAKMVTLLDILWIVVSSILVIINPFYKNLLATVFVIMTEILVVFFVIFQLKGIVQPPAEEKPSLG